MQISNLSGRLALAVTCALVLAGCQSGDPPAPRAAMVYAPSAAFLPPDPFYGQAEARAPAVYVADVETGKQLFEENSDSPRYPASLTKMMTLYLLFEAIQAGRLSLDDALIVSETAAAQPPAKIGLRAGTTLPVRDAAQALAVKSANDVATTVAENLAGSESAFVSAMSAKARALGMTATRFTNASGLPDPRQTTTARDMAILGRALRAHFPRFAHYFAATEYRYAGRRYKATNKLLGKVRGVDGMKTGYTRASGYHLVASARRGGRRIIVVVLGGRSGRARDAQVAELVERYL